MANPPAPGSMDWVNHAFPELVANIGPCPFASVYARAGPFGPASIDVRACIPGGLLAGATVSILHDFPFFVATRTLLAVSHEIHGVPFESTAIDSPWNLPVAILCGVP